MFRVLRDLFRYNREFAIGAILILLVVAMAVASFFSPYPPELQIRRAASTCRPPGPIRSAPIRAGRTFSGSSPSPSATACSSASRWRSSAAIISLVVGLTSGYVGGCRRSRADVDQRHLRRLPALPDPGAGLFRLQGPHVLGAARARHGLPRMAVRRAPDPLGRAEPEDARIHHAEHLLGHEHPADPGRGAPALRAADRLRDDHEQHQLVDRPRGDAVGDRLHQHRNADDRHDDLLGEPAHGAGRRRMVVDRVPGWAGDHDLHRPLSPVGVDERIHRPAQPPQPHGRRPDELRPRNGSAARRGGGLRRRCRSESARLLSDALFRHRARSARRRRHLARRSPQRDLRARRRIEQRQDDASSRPSPPPSGRRSR